MFKYSLRLQLPPSVNFEERLNNLLDFCKIAKVDDVIFFVGCEELNTGHITVEEAKPFVETIKRASKYLKKLGITVSLNPWMTIGHYDGGKTFKAGQNFRGFVGENGSVGKVVVCPLCEEWRKYYAELFDFYIETLDPDTIWLEDDFRLEAHRTDVVIKMGCFCDEHMKLYNERLGTDYDRETFVKLLGTDLNVRKAYLDVSRETMESFFAYLRDNVQGVHRYGFMTGGSYFKEGRRYRKMFDILASGGNEKPYNRFGVMSSRQNAPQLCARYIHGCTLLNRFLTADKAECFTEIENNPHTMYTKSVRFSKFQQLNVVQTLLAGTTFSIFEFNGNGVVNYKRLAKMYGEIKPYLSAVKDLDLLPSDATGVNIFISEDVAYTAEVPSGDYVNGYSDSTGYFMSWFETLGINCRYCDDPEIRNKVVAIEGQVLRALSPERIRKIFADNFVIINGDGVKTLFDMGLNDLIGAKSYETFAERNSIHTFEEINSDKKIQGISGMRATSNYSAGSYLRIDYGNTDKTVYTNIKDCYERFFGCGLTVVGNVLIEPHKIPNMIPYATYHPLREHVIKKVIESSRKLVGETFFAQEENVSTFSFGKDGKTVLMCVNFCDDDYGSLHIRTGKKYNNLKIITPSDPVWRTANVEFENGVYTVNEELKGEESYCLMIE